MILIWLSGLFILIGKLQDWLFKGRELVPRQDRSDYILHLLAPYVLTLGVLLLMVGLVGTRFS